MSELDCPFCRVETSRIFHAGRLVLGIWDNYPVSPGHALLIPKRHVSTWFEATAGERAEILDGIEVAHRAIAVEHAPDGFNWGVNVGPAAGQTVPHLHLHVIPRYRGDVQDPRGGIRYVIAANANYLAGASSGSYRAADLRGPAEGLVHGEGDPLLPHLLSHLDAANQADLAVAFVLPSGVALLEPHLRDLLDRNGSLRLVTGDYLGVTDPDALLRLLDLAEAHPARVRLRIFQTSQSSFHPKAYIFYGAESGDVAYVGSSNLTRTALQEGLEWNYRVIPGADGAGFRTIRVGFERLFADPRTRSLDAAWVQAYRKRRRPVASAAPIEIAPEEPEPVPEPHEIQQAALAALAATRRAGNKAGLVVLATGLGKTWLSAFDSVSCEARRVLFVAHREEILNQALSTFRRIRPEATLGLYTGQEKSGHADVLFASIQTLGRAQHLKRFAPDAFDYIVVDEFHHASAPTYRTLINHFNPAFLLGLTATPERTDGGDLLALCGENLVFTCNLVDGIRAKLLCPFRYFGVPDDVDYRNIPWRSNRFDEEALTNAVATEKRAQNALEQYQEKAGARTLAFCCSKRHADFMASFFRANDVDAVAVHSGPDSAPRALSLERLQAGELPVIFAVDMFNEGVDLPNVDTVMMLRPTESRILWLQQFGRGLRTANGKTDLTVIDYIGNHRTFLLKPQTLFDLGSARHELVQALERLERGELELPPGCEVTYELESLNILRSLLRVSAGGDALRWWYIDFRERRGDRPTAVEAFHEGYNPRSVRKDHGFWLRFVDAMGDLEPVGRVLLGDPRIRGFLDDLETTRMTKSYKMLTLLAMLNADLFPGTIRIEDLVSGVARIADRSAKLKEDLGVSLADASALRGLLEQNPIAAWTGGKGTPSGTYFAYEDGAFRSEIILNGPERTTFQEMTREIIDWRLAEYLARPSLDGEVDASDRISCKLGHADGQPIVFLPDRRTHPELPDGWTSIEINASRYEANFGKSAISTIRRPGGGENELPSLARRWFGHDVGMAGTNHFVQFTREGEGWALKPVGRLENGRQLELWHPYAREQIPSLLGMEFQGTTWQQGFIHQGNRIILLVTLEKQGQPAEHQYKDRFLDSDLLEWQSQNRHSQAGKPGQAMRHHAERGIEVHLFVRRSRKQGPRAAPFTYCGQVDFVDWEGERPITVRWRLRNPLSSHVRNHVLAIEAGAN